MALKDGTAEDYRAAAIRHYRDARTLGSAGNYDNAGHLIGFSAECAIKESLSIIGTGSPAEHLPTLLSAARKRISNRKDYSSLYAILKLEIFSSWSVDHRYSSDGKVEAAQYEEWDKATRRILAASKIREAMQ